MAPPQPIAAAPAAGKKLVLSVAVIAVALSLFTTGLLMLAQGTTKAPPQLLRLVLTMALCFQLVRGAQWARWTCAILFLIGGLLSLGGGVQLLGTPGKAWIMVGFGAIYLYCAGVLMASRSVSAFFTQAKRAA